MRSTESLLRELRRISTDNHRCFGCGHEHSCGIHGCAIIREAMELIRNQEAALSEREQAIGVRQQGLAQLQSKLFDAEQAAATMRRSLSAVASAMDEMLVKHE